LHFGGDRTFDIVMLGSNVDDKRMAIIIAGDKISFFLRNASFLRS